MSIVLPIVAPVFAIIFLGLVAGRSRYVSEGADRILIEFVFRIAIPALLLRTIIEAPAVTGSPLVLYGAFFGSIVIVWTITTLIAGGVLRRPADELASLSLAACFGNLVLLALPITLRALGPEAATPMAIIFLIEFPAMWLAATLQHQLAAAATGTTTVTAVAETMRTLVRNPIIVALAAGAAWRATGLGLEATTAQGLDLLGRAATATSLFALGLSLARFKLQADMPVALVVVALKLLLLPVVGFVLAFHVFTLPPTWAAVVVLFTAMPVGAVAFLFATAVDRGVAPVSMAIAISVALSAVTISLALYALSLQPGVLLKSAG